MTSERLADVISLFSPSDILDSHQSLAIVLENVKSRRW